jgi:hypothetical protein
MKSILTVAATVAVIGFAPARADAPAAGELWETTAQASVPGVPVQMKPYTAKICQKKEWTQPPQTDPNSGDNCRTTDFARAGDTLTWKMACASPPMTGEGQIIFKGSDAYEGEFTMKSEQFEMHMALSGKKVGACDNPQ